MAHHYVFLGWVQSLLHFGFYVILVSIYANCKWLCCGNCSNPDKLPGELHSVVFGFYVTLVSIYANCKWLCSGNYPFPTNYQVSFILLYLAFMSFLCQFMLTLTDISAIHILSCSICLNSALFASIQHFSITLYIPKFVLQNWLMCTKLISVTPVGWILCKMAHHCVILGWVQSLSHFVLCDFSDNFC